MSIAGVSGGVSVVELGVGGVEVVVGIGANGARRVCSLSTSGNGGAISTKIVCAVVGDCPSSIAALTGAGSRSRLTKRRRWERVREGSLGNAESRALTD